MTEQIDDIRAFNRFYTRQIGLLDEHFNDSPLSLPEARVLYEIDARGHTTARELLKVLRMDRGYLSRMLPGSPMPGSRQSRPASPIGGATMWR
jgi:hypothetical protein